MAFAHLHLHTEYSLLDGANRIGPLVSRLKELGFTHAAITDHGVMYGAVDFYNACRDAGITPVIGCEVYICRNRFEKSGAAREYSHMILLCENNTGYQNLIKLVSAGFTEGFYYKPRIDYELLKQHTEGLICLSACLSGDLPKMLLEGRYDDAKTYALQMQELFGRDHYYIELMDHGIPEEKTVLPRLVRVAQETGIPMVVTNDCHYLNREDSKAQEVLLCIQTGKTLQDESRMRMNTEELYVKSEAEMRAVFPNFPEAIENSQKIAQRCQVTFDFGHLHLPHYPIDTGETAEEMLRRLCDSHHARRGQNTDVIRIAGADPRRCARRIGGHRCRIKVDQRCKDRIQRHGIIGKEQQIHGFRRTGGRPVALHRDNAVHDMQPWLDIAMEIGQHFREHGAVRVLRVPRRLIDAADAAIEIFHRTGNAFQGMCFHFRQVD